MVALFGLIGTDADAGDHATDALDWSRTKDRRSVGGSDWSLEAWVHPDHVADVTVDDGGTRLLVFGDVYGHQGASGAYTPRPRGTAIETFIENLHETHGRSFVDGLNGQYLAVYFGDGGDEVSVVTDRLGSVPLFHTWTEDGALALSTSIQALAAHPTVDTAFDPPYLHEYLVFKRTFGVKTPLLGIERLQPGATTTFDVAAGAASVDSYWRPQYQPADEPFASFVDRFAELLPRVIDEWTHEDHSYGVMLSGGSDSRLCLACLEDHPDVTAFHMSDWMNREARIAERAALTAGVPFQWLRRGRDYQRHALEKNPPLNNFNGWFSHGYASGFETEIADTVDRVISGLYADTLFKGHPLPSPSAHLGPMGHFELPVESSIFTVDEYIDWLMDGVSNELDLTTDLRTVLETNIVHRDGGIEHHGVHYESLQDLIQCGMWYPLTNDDDMLFQYSLNQIRPHRSPYLDNRLLDLSLRVPRKYQLRRNLINRALEAIDDDLAKGETSSAGVSARRSFYVEYAGQLINAFRRKFLPRDPPPEPHHSHGPWIDDAELLRSDSFAWERLQEHRSTIEALQMLDWGDVEACYQRHLDGENRIVELYGLLTLVSMPVTEDIAGVRSATDPIPDVETTERTVVSPVTPRSDTNV